ncbi:MAG TPA: hypothetical protein DEP84_09435 [Chloroflexi bacterium]|nr:hypothetical protein [Chloroflexota bacterium]
MADEEVYTQGATTGDTAHIPSGVPHRHKNIGDTPGRLLVMLNPAGNEKFFAELGLPVTDKANPPKPSGPPDIERIRAITSKYQIEPVALPTR